MLETLINKLKEDKERWETIKDCFQEIHVPPHTELLKEGQISNKIYFIKQGSLRLWFNNDGKDITLQFFFEKSAVCSIESFMNQEPSMFTLESIEKTTMLALTKDDFRKILTQYPEIKEGFSKILFMRMGNYARLFLSRIKDTPAKRYKDLIKEHPEILKRIPQHYIASYLGITPVSLSRIRNRTVH